MDKIKGKTKENESFRSDLKFYSMSVVKQCVGIDISKDSFTACLCQKSTDESLIFTEVKRFSNEKTGFNQLVRWVRKSGDKTQDVLYLMEATGVYYESLAYHLYKIKQSLTVVLPNTSKHYFSSLNIKTKTDAVDAKVLSQFGAERKHKGWSPPPKVYLELRNLTRYYVQLQEQKTALNNIKHSKESAEEIQQLILKSNRKLIQQIDAQIERIKKGIQALIDKNTELKAKIGKLQTIKGVGVLTIATIIAETMGFEFIKNRKQLASYAGYDVVQRESGTSIKGKTRISKKGNRYIRNALYFPAMVACRYNSEMKENYLRIIEKKPSKMIGQVAIQRKLLLLLYTLWKNDSVYKEGYKRSSPGTYSQATQDSFVKLLSDERN